MLTKATGLILLPVFAFALLLMGRSGKTSRKDLARYAGMTLGIAFLISGWWFVRNQMLYGQPLPLQLFAQDFGHTVQAATMADAMGGWGAYYLRRRRSVDVLQFLGSIRHSEVGRRRRADVSSGADLSAHGARLSLCRRRDGKAALTAQGAVQHGRNFRASGSSS